MNIKQSVSIGIAVLFFSTHTYAYDPQTHAAISTAAVNASVIETDPALLQSIGIQSKDLFKNSDGIPRSINQLFRDGAEFEDKFPRSLHHFFESLNGRPLSLNGVSFGRTHTSPDWAVDGQGENEFSYQHARKYFYDALTVGPRSGRDKNFGLMFQSLGQVVHHIQDMAQPQHVRNDAHLELKSWQEISGCVVLDVVLGPFYGPAGCAAYFSIKNPSLYESLSAKMSLPFNGYDPVYSANDTTTFNNPRKFWTAAGTSGRIGMADFTNRSFVSAGTNFNNNSQFALPALVPSLRHQVSIQDMLPSTKLLGYMTFYGNWVDDHRTGQRSLNSRASTLSIFDAELTKRGATPVFTLNRFNFELAHGFLIPRAVGYSAGLINYFFRGKMDFILDPENIGKYLIKNLGPEAMKGTFTLYYDDKDGKRHPTPNKWDLDIGVNQSSSPLILKPNLVGSPEPAIPGEYMLVFNGTMGEEKPDSGSGSPGAVVAQKVKDPLAIKVTNLVFFIWRANRFNPVDKYEVDFNFELDENFAAIMAAGKDEIKLIYNGVTIPCPPQPSGIMGRAGIFCTTEDRDYIQLQMDPIGDTNYYEVPYFAIWGMPDTAGLVTLMLGDVTLMQYKFVPQFVDDFPPGEFKESFHFDTAKVKFGGFR